MRSHTNAVPGPSTSRPGPINLTQAGPTPGVLDPTQKARILRDTTSTISFSAFDPLTAGGQDASLNLQRRLNIQDDRPAPKRIVIEISRTGQSTWRFVPRARREEGVDDEGIWPRVLDICGNLVYCSQDQWDIYKLDPNYDCLVKKFPSLSTIRPTNPHVRHPTVEPTPLGKRAYGEGEVLEPESPKKRVHYDVTMESIRSTSEDGDDEDEEEEDLVAEMITDEQQARYRNPTPTAATSRPLKQPTPLPKERSPLTPRMAKPVNQPGPKTPTPLKRRKSQSVPPESIKKRKEIFETKLDTTQEEEETEEEGPRRKKVNFEAPRPVNKRTPSNPPVTQRELRAKKREREEQKRKRWEEEQQARIRLREERLMRDAMENVPPPSNTQPGSQWNFHGHGNQGLDRDSSMRGFSDFEDEKPAPGTGFSSAEEAARAAAIEESRRKLAELEADRPIWETAAKERAAREEAEQSAARAKAEAKRRKEQDRAQQERERVRRQQEEAEAQLRHEEEEKEVRRTQRAKERQARKARWTSGKWTIPRAVERFKETSDYFDMARFSEEHPLSIDDVPWPTLRHPDAFSLPEDVDWDSVEHFFDILKNHMRTQEYITLVEKSHRRFHPDRWRSRGLFKSVIDSEERNWMEVAATTVSQALTPIWQKVRVMKQA
ncbi:hypothetical protein D9611_003889 [Ephemerocybe angulata]|uniref:Uncharacterized protein n=1 Tax=Ephemerocybe angulata TaxID=980116 RepID=A0A8H5EYG6_9AGAR|nr:hypothetical protein D9611_003889 [Tulosesus angulatus]